MNTIVRQFLVGTAFALAFAAHGQAQSGRVTILEFTPHGLVSEAAARIEAEDYAGAIELLEPWPAELGEPPPAALYLLAASHRELGDSAKALPLAESAATLDPDAPATWLELVAALLKERGEHRAAIPWLERLVEKGPGVKTYWLELSLAYEQNNDYERALATMRLAQAAALLTDDADFRRLADLLLHEGLPSQAADVLEQALDARAVRADEAAFTKLGAAWSAAGELDKAVLALENAARIAANGDAYVRLAALHVERRAWAAAVPALHAAMGRGSLTDEAHANLLMGIALYWQGKPAEAREWFATAAESAQHRALAREYLDAIAAGTAPAL